MPHQISKEACTACGACAEVCPEGAITFVAVKGCYSVNPEKCIDCGACLDACASGAARSH